MTKARTKDTNTGKAHHSYQEKPRPMTGAERQKNYRIRQKKAYNEKTLNRKQLNQYLKEKKRRPAKNKPRTCKTTSSTSTATIQWMNEAKSIQGGNYTRLATHMRHACTPSFVFGGADPLTAKDKGNREIFFLDDNKRWQHWLNKKRSTIAGFGIFAARDFNAGAIITRYIGQKTTSVAVSKRMLKNSKGYVFQFQTKNNKNIWVAPDLSKSYMYGHFLNHSTDRNCVVDRLTGIITTIYEVKKGVELTIDYGNEYDWDSSLELN